MRIVLLFVCLCAAAIPHAGETWLFSEYAETDALASVHEGVDSPAQSIPPSSEALIVFFSVATDCMPYFQVLTREGASAFSLRVDDGETHEFRWFDAADDGIVATTIAPGDGRSQEDLQAHVAEAYEIARNLMEGNSVKVALRPSGRVLRWSLRDSRNIISKAYRHCAVGIDDKALP